MLQRIIACLSNAIRKEEKDKKSQLTQFFQEQEMSRFAYEFNYDLGSLDSHPEQRSTFLRDNQYENDIYEFDIHGTRNINLSLNSISAGDDADLYLYRDSNHNGILDSSDIQVSSSLHFGNNDDMINYRASEGTYFTRVNYYSSQGNNRIDYDLDLSADFTGSGSSTIAVEKDFGYSLYGHAAAVESDYISNHNTSDTYAVSVVHGEVINLTLSGLSSDADLRVIQDHNHNNVVDFGEVYATSTNLGSSSEHISLDQQGEYFVEVYQYSGDTSYTLQFDQYFV